MFKQYLLLRLFMPASTLGAGNPDVKGKVTAQVYIQLNKWTITICSKKNYDSDNGRMKMEIQYRGI